MAGKNFDFWIQNYDLDLDLEKPIFEFFFLIFLKKLDRIFFVIF